MLKPMYQSSYDVPPRATGAIVVPKPFEKLMEKAWPPTRFSTPKLTSVSPGA